MNGDQPHVDALVIGSGPAGCTFARKLVEGGRSVCVVDAGPKHSPRPGAHLKNAAIYQRNIDLFASVIRGHLHLLSVPSNDQPVVTLDPDAFQVDFKKYSGFTRNSQNPDQNAGLNLPAAAATYGVGGMATHWTCATPRHHPTIERADCISPGDWDDLYTEGERLLNTHTDVFTHSIRHQVVRETLAAEYGELADPYAVQNLPLAVERRTDDPRFVHWSGTDTVLGPLADDDHGGRFMLYEQHLCKRLVPSGDRSRIEYAEIVDLSSTRVVRVEADAFVVACGAVLTPQVLYSSGIRPQALGRYLTEQPVAFCQIVLRQSLVDWIESTPASPTRWRPIAGGPRTTRYLFPCTTPSPTCGSLSRRGGPGTARSTATPSTTATWPRTSTPG